MFSYMSEEIVIAHLVIITFHVIGEAFLNHYTDLTPNVNDFNSVLIQFALPTPTDGQFGLLGMNYLNFGVS